MSQTDPPLSLPVDAAAVRRSTFGDKLCLVYLFATPVYYLLPRVPGLDVNPLRVVGLGLVFTAVGYVMKYGSGNRMARACLLAVAALVVLRIVWSCREYPALLVAGETFQIVCLLSMLVILSARCSQLQMETFLRAVIVASIVATCLAVGVSLHAIPIPSWSQAEDIFWNTRTGWVVDPILGVLGQLASLLLLLTARNRNDKLISLIGLPMSCLNVLMGQFRSHIALSVFLVGGLLLHVTRSRRLVGLAVAVMLAGVLIVLDPLGRVSAVAARFHSDSTLALDEIRRSELATEIELIRQQPWRGHGYGLGRYESHYVPGIGEMNLFGHNLYTSTAARVGVPLAIVFLGGWLALAHVCFRASWRTEQTSHKLLAWSGMLVVLGVLLIGPVENLFTMAIVAPAFAFFIAPWLRPASGEDS